MRVFNHRLKSMEEKMSCGCSVPGRPGWPGPCTPWCGGWKVSLPVAGDWNQMMFKSLPHQSILGHQEGARAQRGLLLPLMECWHSQTVATRIPSQVTWGLSTQLMDPLLGSRCKASISVLCPSSPSPAGTGGDLLTFMRKTLDWLHRWV